MKGKVFTAQEVQSILNGSKVMFREVIKPQPPLGCHYTINGNQSHALCFVDCKTPRDERDYSKEPLVCVPPKPTSIDHRLKCPHQVGQKIFVKERFFVSNYIELRYEANLSIDEKYYWLPAIKMKQEHSRITLEITDVKVERLASISEEDAIKEGVWNIQEKGSPRNWDIKNAFATFWNATHKKPEEKFETNPFVWVVDFKINK